MGLNLFDGSDGSDGEDAALKIEINKEFAQRYEHNKKREDLQRLEELKKKGVVEDSSGSDSNESSDDESAGDQLVSSKKDLEFLRALIKVKNQDPELKNKEAKLFESEDEEEEGNENVVAEGKGDNTKKPKYLKDVASRHLIEEGPAFEDQEEGSEFDDEDDEGKEVKSYSEELEEMRREFFDAVEELQADDGGDLIKVKERSIGDEIEDGTGDVDKKLDEYFGQDDNLDENELFLKDYFRNRMWLDNDKGDKGLDEGVLGFSDEEEEIEKQEDYEREYNFRFEENAGDRVLGHSRFVEGSVRKKTNARKVQRKSKQERMAQEEFERKEELKHLKNLKKKEMKEKLKKIQKTAGIGEDGACLLNVDDLEEDFDPDEYDRKMKAAFNDDYYDADDAEPHFQSDRDEDYGNLEKPDFDKEDELLGLLKGWDDVPISADGFLAVREKNWKRRTENKDMHEQLEEDKEMPEEGKRKKKRKMSKLEKEVLDKELEEYYKLDYEDTIGDLKTRFKYKEVGAKRYGLSAEEILMLDDKELNQYVSLKKLAPYREQEWKVPRHKRYEQKQRNTLLLQGEALTDQRTGKKNDKVDDKKSIIKAKENAKMQAEESNGGDSNLSRHSRRRRRQAELKLSQSRLMAYGKIPSKSKKKKKH